MRNPSLLFALYVTFSLLSGCVADEATPEEALAPVVTTESSVLEKQPAPAGDDEILARDYCCIVDMDPPVICHQWHTAAIWAGPKCVAAGIGLNRRGSSLYRGSCSAFPQC